MYGNIPPEHSTVYSSIIKYFNSKYYIHLHSLHLIKPILNQEGLHLIKSLPNLDSKHLINSRLLKWWLNWSNHPWYISSYLSISWREKHWMCAVLSSASAGPCPEENRLAPLLQSAHPSTPQWRILRKINNTCKITSLIHYILRWLCYFMQVPSSITNFVS